MTIITRVDISRLIDEMEQLDNDLTASMVRTKAGVATDFKPKLSTQLEAFLVQNKLILSNGQQREQVIAELRTLKEKAPAIHMTFAVPADRESLQQLVQWIRSSAHPQAIISVGLQPALIAGVHLRTPNHVHDLSLRAMFKESHAQLVDQLETLRKGVANV